jgi:hypothetical protein
MAWHVPARLATRSSWPLTTSARVLETISYIETLTTELSNKIWQKISLLPRL